MSEGITPPPATDQRGELIGRLKSKLKEFVNRVKALETERDTAVTERTAALAKATKAEADFDAAPLKGEVDRLKATLRERDHRTVFDRIARAKGAADDALDLVYQTSGYKAEKDQADEEAIGTMLEELKAKPGVARLFGEVPAEPERRLAPAKGQGPRVGEGSRVKATQAQLRDHVWAYQNRQALREKRVDLVD